MQSLLTACEVAEMLKVRPKRVYELGIPFVRLSPRCKRWEPNEVRSWIEKRARPPGS